MPGRKLLYVSIFTLAFASLALEAEAERAKAAGETGASPAAADDPWRAEREEIFRFVTQGAVAKAEAKADELLKRTQKEGTNADQVDALSIRGRVAASPEARRGYYEKALKIATANVFAKNPREHISYLSLSYLQQDLGDVAMEQNDKATTLRNYQAALDSLSAFDLQTYLAYGVSPDARYGHAANELRLVVGWLNLSEGRMDDAEAALRLAEKGMLFAGGRVEDGVRIGLAVTARYRGHKQEAEARLADVEKRREGARGLASASSTSPTLPAMIQRARAYFETGDLAELRW